MNEPLLAIDEKRLLDDLQIALLLAMSRSFVRKQRWLRRHGHPHALDIDPVFVGSKPRYRLSDVMAWLERLTPTAKLV